MGWEYKFCIYLVFSKFILISANNISLSAQLSCSFVSNINTKQFGCRANFNNILLFLKTLKVYKNITRFQSNFIARSISLVTSDNLAHGRSKRGSNNFVSHLPSWLNLTLAQQGQQFARNNYIGIAYSAILGIIAVTIIPDIRNILLFTSNSDTQPKAVTRYLATAIQTFLWMEDILKIDSKDNAFLTSISNIRQIHLSVAKRANQHGQPFITNTNYRNISTDDQLWSSFGADLNISNISQSQRLFTNNYLKYDTNPIPINQFSLALTQFAFHGYLILNPRSVFVSYASDEDLQAYVHLWAVIGYVVGIDDQYNVCLHNDLVSTKLYFQDIQNKYINPALFNMDHETKVLVEALFNGMNNYLPGFSGQSFLLRYLRDIVRIPVPNLSSSLNFRDWMFEQLYYVLAPLTYIQFICSVVIRRVVYTAMHIMYGFSYVTNMDIAQHFYYHEIKHWIPFSMLL